MTEKEEKSSPKMLDDKASEDLIEVDENLVARMKIVEGLHQHLKKFARRYLERNDLLPLGTSMDIKIVLRRAEEVVAEFGNGDKS